MTDRTAILAVVVTLAVVAFLGFQIVGMDVNQEQLDAEREAFAEYCNTEFGEDADVYRANDAYSAEHNGLHCDHDDGTVHRTQIPPEIWEAYMAGEVSADYVTSQLEEPPGILPLPDLPLSQWVTGVGLVVVLLWMMIWAVNGGVPPRF